MAIVTLQPTGARLRVLLMYDRSNGQKLLLGGNPLEFWRPDRWGEHAEVVEIRPGRWFATARSIGFTPLDFWRQLSPSGSEVATAGRGDEIAIWAPGSSTPVFRIPPTQLSGGRPLRDAKVSGLEWDETGQILAYTVEGHIPSPATGRDRPVVQLLTTDRDGNAEFCSEIEGVGGYPEGWSPTGGWIALAIRAEPEVDRQLVVVARDGQRVVRGPAGWYLASQPAWHPSGERLYATLHDGAAPLSRRHYALWEVGLAQASCRLLVAPGYFLPLACSSDGGAVLVAQFGADEKQLVGFGSVELPSGTYRLVVPRPPGIRPEADVLRWSVAPDRRSLAVVVDSDNSTICLWRLDTLAMDIIGPRGIIGLDRYWARGLDSIRLVDSGGSTR